MNKQTKTLLGLGAVAVALYFILKRKIPKSQTQNTSQNRGKGAQPYVPCNFNDGEIVDVVGWLNSDLPNIDFSIVNEYMCMGRTLPSNLNLLEVEQTMTSDVVQYKGKGMLKSSSMVTDAIKRDESVPIIYT
jgi:hypothetical protein